MMKGNNPISNFIMLQFLFAILVLSTLGPSPARASWTVVTEDTIKDNGIIFVEAIDADSTAIVGIQNSAWVLRRSDDAGETWQDFSVTGELALPMFMTAHFQDELHGWLGGMGAVYRTEDGVNFTEVQIPGEWWGPFPLSTVRYLRSYGRTQVLAVGDSSSMSGTSSVLILTTEDGGLTWTEVENTLAVSINALEAVDETHTWMAGANGTDLDGDDWPDRYDSGTILFSADRGQTWNALIEGLSFGVYYMDFTDTDRGWAVGTDGTDPIVIVTEDGGASWRSLDLSAIGVPSDAEELTYVTVLSPCEIWLIGHRMKADTLDDLFLHSLDGGNSFDEEFDYDGQSVMFTWDFAGRAAGWAAGAYMTLLRYEPETADPGTGCTFPGGEPVVGEESVTEEVAEAVEEDEPAAELEEAGEAPAEVPDAAEDGTEAVEDAQDAAEEEPGEDGGKGGCGCAVAL